MNTFFKVLKRNSVNVILFVVLFDYCIIHFCVLQDSVAAAALQDYGYLSVMTLLFIGLCQLMAFWNCLNAESSSVRFASFALFYVLMIYFMREADLHSFFTDKNVTSLKFYTKSKYPLAPKLVAGPILGIFFALFAYIIIRYGLWTVKAFFRGEPWAVAIGVWGTLLVISQIWDHAHFPDNPWRVKLMEEYLEFAASAYLPAAMILFYIKKKKISNKLENIN